MKTLIIFFISIFTKLFNYDEAKQTVVKEDLGNNDNSFKPYFDINSYVFNLIDELKYSYGYGDIPTNLLLAQALHETNHLKSRVFRSNANLFGMKQARIRKNTAKGTRRGHATYLNKGVTIQDKEAFCYGLELSVRDIFLWLDYSHIIYGRKLKKHELTLSKDDVFMNDVLSKGYAEDKKYKMKWVSHYKRLQKINNSIKN